MSQFLASVVRCSTWYFTWASTTFENFLKYPRVWLKMHLITCAQIYVKWWSEKSLFYMIASESIFLLILRIQIPCYWLLAIQKLKFESEFESELIQKTFEFKKHWWVWTSVLTSPSCPLAAIKLMFQPWFTGELKYFYDNMIVNFPKKI